MSTLALNELLEYILSLSLTNKNKDWLAERILMSKTAADSEKKQEERLYSLFGAWNNEKEMDRFEESIKNGRVSGVTRNLISFDEI